MYYNLLSELKNAVRARKDKLMLPYNRMDFAIATILVEQGYMKGLDVETIAGKKTIVIRLSKNNKGKEAFNDFALISKPSRHFYKDYRSLRPVKQGHGIGVLTTSKGLMTDKEARKQKIGGEYLFEIW